MHKLSSFLRPLKARFKSFKPIFESTLRLSSKEWLVDLDVGAAFRDQMQDFVIDSFRQVLYQLLFILVKLICDSVHDGHRPRNCRFDGTAFFCDELLSNLHIFK